MTEDHGAIQKVLRGSRNNVRGSALRLERIDETEKNEPQIAGLRSFATLPAIWRKAPHPEEQGNTGNGTSRDSFHAGCEHVSRS